MPKQKNPILQNEKIVQFLNDEIKNAQTKKSYSYSIVSYMKYRNFSSVEELLKSGEKEISHLLEYQEISKTTRIASSHLRRFLRFFGCKIQVPGREKRKKDKFDNDSLMQSWKNYYSNKGTADNVVRALTNFCKFHKTTPTKLKEDVENFSKGIIKSMLKNYYNDRVQKVKHQVAWTEVNYVKIFFREFLEIEFQWRRQDIPTTPRGIISEEDFELENFKESITKDNFRAMLYHADLFEKAVLHTMWSSGLSNIDVCRLQFKSFKNIINPFDPVELTEEFYLFHHIRSKTKISFYGVISKKALELIQAHLRKQYHYTDSIPDDTYIFTSFYSKKRIYPGTIRRIVTKLISLAELETNITPAHFRKTFYRKCREEAQMDKTIVEILMGHWRGNGTSDDSSLMSDYHYGDRKAFYENLKTKILEEMQKSVDMRLFDLEKDDLKYMQLEREMNDELSYLKEEIRKRDERFIELKMEFEEMKEIRTTQAEIYEQEREERLAILETQEPVENLTKKLTQEELKTLKELIAKVSS
ncbi:MAG TPA: tyrosine-type recombinase/integrase [Candidatus Bathyarchaeia archaeon]|nr:tyrosine-type recombinase/integrase [Candidatus Bathyarchaeia archaeon]